MEEVLEEYASPCPANTVRLSFDERPCQLIGEVYSPIKMREGKPQKYDCEYQRKGTACLLMAYDIDSGTRYAEVRSQKSEVRSQKSEVKGLKKILLSFLIGLHRS